MAYDYYKEMKQDILDKLPEYSNHKDEFKDALITALEDDDKDDLIELMEELFWTEDGITGNGSGSYFFNTYKSAEAVFDNIDLLQEAVRDFDCSAKTLAEHFTDYEWQDVTIRCYILNQVLWDIMDDDFDKITEIIEKM